MNRARQIAVLATAAAVAAGCASSASAPELDAQAVQVMNSSFRDQGIAKVERLNQDLAQQACSSAKPPSEQVARRINAEAEATIRWPADGQYFGDWREGEKLAQSGRGMTWTDPSASFKDSGGNCYNCHQIDKREISFGTIGPSLWNYGKARLITDVTEPRAVPIVKYTWGKLWNSRAYVACSNMPRFGHNKLLDEQQLRDLMSLLLDPKSPVNSQ